VAAGIFIKTSSGVAGKTIRGKRTYLGWARRKTRNVAATI